jgi:hypothetical protein
MKLDEYKNPDGTLKRKQRIQHDGKAERQCAKCKDWKPVAEFTFNFYHRTPGSYCKECERANQAAYRAERRAKGMTR